MPFTFAHPAIILPLSYLPKRWFSLTGLIIGSMTPDFEYFLRMNVQSIYSHTFLGVFWFDLPLGILLWFLFHKIVKHALYENLPHFLKTRFSKLINFDFITYFQKNYLVVIVSILIGAFSHIFWDSFTHETGFFVTIFPSLLANLYIFQHEIPTYKLLQHLSTFIGGLVIIFTISNMKKDKIPQSNFTYKYWFLVLIIFTVVLWIRFATGLNFRHYGQVILTAISAALIALICVPLFLNSHRNRER